MFFNFTSVSFYFSSALFKLKLNKNFPPTPSHPPPFICFLIHHALLPSFKFIWKFYFILRSFSLYTCFSACSYQKEMWKRCTFLRLYTTPRNDPVGVHLYNGTFLLMPCMIRVTSEWNSPKNISANKSFLDTIFLSFPLPQCSDLICKQLPLIFRMVNVT